MTTKARLTELASRISEKPKNVKTSIRNKPLEVNPPHGEKGNFVKVTVTLPPPIYELIAQEATRRKMAKERDPLISAIIREAVFAYLQRKGAPEEKMTPTTTS